MVNPSTHQRSLTSVVQKFTFGGVPFGCAYRKLQLRSEGDDVVVPENGFDFGKIGFGEIGAGVGGAIIYAADFEGERIGLRCDDEICAKRSEFRSEAVADVERNAQCGGDDSHAKRER